MTKINIQNIKKLLAPLHIYKNWWVFYIDFFNLSQEKKILFSLFNGVKFYMKSGQTEGLIINEIWGEKVYTPESFLISEKDTVVDIGAHKGVFSIYAAKKAVNGVVYSFEPFKENISFLKKNIQINKCKNISVFETAVSNKNGYDDLYIKPDFSAGISSIKSEYTSGNEVKKIKVKAITLEKIFKMCKIDKINFLKIDCEGGEYKILLNTPKELFKRIDKISMEYHQINEYKIGVLKDLLLKYGFKVSVVPVDNVIGMLYATK